MNRNVVIGEIEKNETWDILVIGGGSTGLGTALEAATRGYKVLLVEQSDFAKSTSGKSTKLIHGGVRYLAQGNIRLVREANIERGLLMKNASGLVSDQEFIIPVYSLWQKIKYLTGLKLYDWIAGWSSLGATEFISTDEVKKAMPGLKLKGFAGGVKYHDGRFDDARFAITLAKKIFKQGGFAINYLKVTSLHKSSGKLSSITAIDVVSGKIYDLNSKAIVNATGVFADDILKMDHPSAAKTLNVSQGIHLVFDKSVFNSNHALMIPETKDGRVLFVIPWHDKVLAGTTDTPVKETSLEPVATEKEITFILETMKEYLQTRISRRDIKSMFAGLRPLAATGKQSTKEISRGHKIMISASGLLSIIGGKWTTYRKMGEDVINAVEHHLKWSKTKSITASLNLTDNDAPYNEMNTVNNSSNNVPDEIISSTFQLYASTIIAAVKNEMAVTVDDMLSRRTRILLLDAAEAIRITPQVAHVMAIALNKNEDWINGQIEEFNLIAGNYLIKDKLSDT